MNPLFIWLVNLVGITRAQDIEDTLEKSKDVGAYVSTLYVWVLGVGASLGVLIVIYAGYLYTTSQGNPDSLKTAKELIIGVLLGLALIILAGVILKNVGVIGI